MIAVQIDVSDKAGPVVRAIERAVQPRRLRPIVGRAATNAFRSHLFALNNQRANALGGTRTNFYASAARGTHFEVVEDGVIVSVNQVGIRQRVLGGTIKPRAAKYLTIPARAEAYGKRAGEFNDLVIVTNRAGKPIALARRWQSQVGFRRDKGTGAVVGTTRRGERGSEILFWLVTSVTQQPDPSVVPQALDLFAAITTAINAHVDLAVARATQGPEDN